MFRAMLAVSVILLPMPRHMLAAGLPRRQMRVITVAGGLELTGNGMAVRFTANPWNLVVLGTGGRVLVRGDGDAIEFTIGGRVVHPRALQAWTMRGDVASICVTTDDPVHPTERIAIRFPARGLAAIDASLAAGNEVTSSIRMRSGADEHFFGLGEQFGGVDQRGHIVPIRVQNGMTTLRPDGGYAPSPFFVSSRGYGFYLQGFAPSQFSLAAPPYTDHWQVTAQSAALSAYVIDGPQPAAVLARYGALAGHAPMPPPWSLGVWKTVIGGQARVEAEARRLRHMHIPVSVLWSYDAVDESVGLGWPYPIFARIPPGSYPRLAAFTAALHREGFQVLGYLSPEFTRSRASFAYPAGHDYFVRGTGGTIYLLDLTNRAALRWWEGNMRRILTNLGFDGWLLDLGDRLPPGARFSNGQNAAVMANRYPLLLAQSAARVMRAARPSALIVMRSSFAGAQSLQPAVWPGDQRGNWSPAQGLPAAIRAGLSWGISGAPFWGSDIGGYLDGGLPLALQQELWTRWLEFGALSPIMRDQLGNKGFGAIYLWSNKETERLFTAYARLHQSLFPYLYAAARTAHRTGMPIMRHLFLAYARDPRVYGIDDAYLLGPDLLAAPVVKQGARSRAVYLPRGAWIDYWTGARLAGGRTVSAPAPLDRIPLYVRGGAIIPFLADAGDTLAPAVDRAVHRAGAALRLQLYPGGAGERVTLADGTTLAYIAGATRIDLRVAGPARRYVIDTALRSAPTTVRLDGGAVPHAARLGGLGWSFAGPRGALRVVFTASAGHHALAIVGAV